jgi:peptide/nickel transport system permease protein
VGSGPINPEIAYQPGFRGLLQGWGRRWTRRVRTWRTDLGSFLTKPIGAAGIAIILFFGLLGLVHPLLMSTIWDNNTYDPFLGFDLEITHPSMPSAKHWLGTDYRGRDVFSMLAFATRTSFGVGLIAAIAGTVIATVVGVTAAYTRGIIDSTIMTITDTFLLLPPAIVLLTIGLIVRMNWIQVGLVYGVFAGLGSLTLLVKAHAQTIKSKQYIEAGRVAGDSGWRIIRVHILPNLTSVMAMNMMFIVTGSVLIEALLSYITDTSDRFSWGTMIWQTQENFRGAAEGLQWHVLIPPAIAIMLFCGAFYMVGRTLDDVVNPRLKSQ